MDRAELRVLSRVLAELGGIDECFEGSLEICCICYLCRNLAFAFKLRVVPFRDLTHT